MKDRLIYSPKDNKNHEKYEVNFKKSPNKYAMYDIPHQSHELPYNNTSRPFPSTSQEFDNIKKITQETAALRQTMNNKMFNRIQKSHTLQLQDDGKNKLNDFLRQTIGSNKPNRVYSDTLIPDNAYSNDTYDRAIGIEDKNRNNNKYFQTYRIQQRKGTNALNDASSLRDYEVLSEKINRNKQLIAELRNTNKDVKGGKDLLKNVNHHRSPTFLHIDSNKQKQQPLHFTKRSKKDEINFLTPKIDKGNFESRFNSSPLIQKAKSAEKKSEEQTIGSFSTISSYKKKTSIFTQNKGVQVEDFILNKKLGQGKFGCVYMARHKCTNGVFAIKKIPKNLIKSNMMVDQLALQIRIQSCTKHRNMLELYGCFDDKTHLYMVLEYMDGGTLYQRCKKQRLQQKQTAMIIRQVTSALDYLHDLGIAHRDVKPQNVVISNNVYKLCDFGWAAICNQRRKTYCGTFDYVAPEILEGVQYDMTVDLWCLGVLTYQLLTGKAPFYHISRKETMKKILNVENENLVFPQGMSEVAKDFIDKLIRKDPIQRIRTSEALLHPFLVLDEELY